MKNLKLTGIALILTILLTLITSIGNIYAQETKTSGSASVDLMSNYVWRG